MAQKTEQNQPNGYIARLERTSPEGSGIGVYRIVLTEKARKSLTVQKGKGKFKTSQSSQGTAVE